MMSFIRNPSKLVMMVCLLITLASACKSKKKALEAANAATEKARIEQEASDRKLKEEELKKQEAANARKQAEEQAAAEAKRQNESKASEPKSQLTNYFNSISNSSNPASANSAVAEALNLFASPETPVFIVISESGGQKDYDRPTTIKAYLNYLKDQKKNINTISNLVFNTAGKISEVELRKN